MGFFNLSDIKEIVIIGCGAGGGTAAQFARKTDRKSNITIFEKGKYPQYSKCGLPYVLSEKISDPINLKEFDEEWFKKAKIELYLETIVEKIDIDKKILFAKKDNKTIEKSFDKLIISTGANPFLPPIKNIKSKGVFTVRTIDNIKEIKAYINNKKNITIVGAGLIGLEIADNLHKKRFNICIVEAMSSILENNLDPDMARTVFEKIPNNIDVKTDYLAKDIISKNGKVEQIKIENKKTGKEEIIDSDAVIIATGIRPETSLAKQIGCKIGETGGIIVNNKSETNIRDVYAIGDCTEYKNYISNKDCLVGLGSIVVRQAIAAGVNAAGGQYILPKGLLNTNTSEFFGVEIAGVGLISKNIDKEQAYAQARFNGSSLPEYFPGGKPISVKILVDEKNKKILGAQAVGENAAQRINTFACAILGEMNIDTIRKLETAYAPPIAPTLDVVTLVCDMADLKISRKR